jgi:ATP-binding cassette subfamily C protein CydD
VTLRIFGRHYTQGSRIQKIGDQYTDETMKVLKVSFLSALVLELAATISVALIAVSVGLRLVAGQISFIHSLTVLILAPEVFFPLRNAASLFHASADGTEVLGQLREIQMSKVTVTKQVSRDFEFARSVHWNRWKLDIPGVMQSSIDAGKVNRGETIFIIGESGIGKTTFAEKLLGVHSESEILIDGIGLKSEEIVSFQSSVGWIPQLPRLAPGNIREQFQLIQPSISDAAIQDLLNELDLPLNELPHGLDTQLGGSEEKSSELSGGQIRKIAVARALIRKPFLIIADEPTADLDSHSADVILKMLRKAVKEGAALICITHISDIQLEGERTLTVERVDS